MVNLPTIRLDPVEKCVLFNGEEKDLENQNNVIPAGQEHFFPLRFRTAVVVFKEQAGLECLKRYDNEELQPPLQYEQEKFGMSSRFGSVLVLIVPRMALGISSHQTRPTSSGRGSYPIHEIV